jgi:hypothetical protein
VARLNIEEEHSPFYPPRARWWSGFFYPWFRFQRALHLEKIHCPTGFSVGAMFLALLVPGVSFCVLGRRILGLSILAIYCASVPVYFVRLGFTEGSFAYGLMLAAHATSVFYLLSHWMGEMELFSKIGMAFGSLLVVWLVLYFPMVSCFQRHFAVPLLVRGQVVVMQPHLEPSKIERGDRIMFNLTEMQIGRAHGGDGAVWLRAGAGWGPVLALPGDQIMFSTNSFSVNGVVQPLLEHMPAGGEIMVPTNRWFVWPEFAISSHGNVSEANISAMIMQLATVSATQMAGRPYPTWFWRKQKLP